MISGGRFELGIGAGWKKDEWEAYGYGFPPIGERLDAFGDDLEVITRMLAPGRATYEGAHAHVRDAINVPKGIQQPRIPIIVGGNGEQRTAGYAIQFADELNFVFLDAGRDRRADRSRPAALRGRGPRSRRRSASRSTSATRTMRDAGQTRVDLLAGSRRSGSTGSWPSRRAGRRRPRRRRRSRRMSARPGSSSRRAEPVSA